MVSASPTRASPIPLRTKFYRPSLPSDLVDRPRLIEPMNRALDRPLTLVAAPAGYGKSILVSSWLNTCERPSAWLSLDETVDDLGSFLAYFVTAIQTVFSGALQRTQTLLTGMSLPPIGVLAGTLINELDELERDFILVLEDYHAIRKQEIHDLLTALLQPPAKHMHLVLITRKDPPLPMSVLLARNQVAEIRSYDLRFSADETAAFMRNALGSPLPDEAIDTLAEKTEGWITSLRLAALTLRHSPDADGRIAGLRALERNRNLTDYLMSEVLSQASPAVEDFLLKTAILDRMCGPLCEALLGYDDLGRNGQARLEWLEQNNLFTAFLDNERRWYRYHHLFRGFLQNRLEQWCDAGEVALLHARASAWFAGQGLLEEALQHALLGHDTPAAVRLMAEHRHALMDSELWQLHERAFRMFPVEAVAAFPDLMLMAAWKARLGGSGAADVLDRVDRAESLAAQMADQPEHAVHLRGEIDTLRTIVAYETAADPDEVIALARRALATTPRAWYYVRSSAWLYLALAHQMTGRLDRAYAAVSEGQPEDVAEDGAVRARVAAARCFIEWMAGDLQAMPQGVAHILAVGETHHRLESLGWAHYLFSSAAYQRNDLPAAEAHARSVEEIRYLGRPMAYLQTAFIDASICQARGLPDQARQKLDLAFDFVRETRSDGLLPLAQAFQAELAARQGDLGAAGHWAATAKSHVPLTAMSYFYAPQLALPKILLAQDTPASREQAAEVLSRLHDFVTSTHNTRFTIEVLALQALFHHAQGNNQSALAALEQAVTLAQPGGFIRAFVDLGPAPADLLRRMTLRGATRAYVDQILAAFAAERSSPPPQSAAPPGAQAGLIEPLTRRELQVLDLLAQRMTAKEIAQVLILSDQTVKRHTANIYQKFGVHSRRQAVDSALSLGILPAASRSGPA
jgi:LuxR family transcriptional regulator, maltose regulon positive regulatory protein